MLNKKYITFILTLHSPLDYELKYWSKVSKEIIDIGYQFIIINDNEQKNEFKNYFTDGQIFIQNENNLGKLKSLISSYDYINSKMVKVLDPDDKLDVNAIEFINDRLKINQLNFFKGKKFVKSLPENYKAKTKRCPKYRSASNEWTIFPSWILNSNYINKFNRTDFADDQIIGLTYQLEGGSKINYIDSELYFYKKNNGITSSLNTKKFYENAINMLIELDLIISEILLNNDEIVLYLNWPSKTYYRYILFRNLTKLKFRVIKNHRNIIKKIKVIRKKTNYKK